MPKRKFSKKKQAVIDLDDARKKASELAPEVKDGLTDRAEALSVNLKLSEAELHEMEKWIFDRMDDAFNATERRDALDRVELCKERYENGVARDDMPSDNAHDVRLRWGAGQCDTFSVRLSEGLFGVDPIARVSPRSSSSVEKAPMAEKFLDWWHDEYWHLGDRGPDIVDNVTREGHRVLHIPYRLEILPGVIQQVEKRKYEDPLTGRSRWVDVDSMSEMVKAIEDGFQSTEEYKIFDVKRDKVVMNGPDLEDLPLADYLCPANALPGTEDKLPWEAVRQWHMFDTILEMDREGELYAGRKDQIEKHLVEPTVEKSGDAKTGSPAKTKGQRDAMVETWLWYGLYQLPGDDTLSRIVALIHPATKKVLFARPRREEHWESACVHLRFLEMSWRFAGVSAMELFDSIEQAAQNLINYTLDETYFMASTSFTYRENRFFPEDHPLRPMHGLPVKSHNDINWRQGQDRRPMDLNLVHLLLGFGEQRVNIGPYQQGQESGKNKNPTARGIFMLLDQASKLFNRAVRGQLKGWKAVFTKELALWQQTMPDYMAVDAVGSDGKSLFPLGMGRRHISGKFSFDLSGNVENVIYELDRQATMGLYDLMKDNPLVKASLTSFYNLTEDVWKSFKRKRKLLPELAELQKKLNLEPTPPVLTRQGERDLIAELKARGIKDNEIEEILKKVTAPPVDRPIPKPPMPGAGGMGGAGGASRVPPGFPDGLPPQMIQGGPQPIDEPNVDDQQADMLMGGAA